MATLDRKPALRAGSCSHCELTRDVSPRVTLNLGRRGTPTPPSHPFLTVRFPLVLPVCTCFPSLSPSPLAFPRSLRGFNILSARQSLRINRGFCHTPPLVCDRTQSTLSFSLSLSLFRPSLHLSLPPFFTPCLLLCTLFHPSFCRFPSPSVLASVWLSSVSRAICFLWQLFFGLSARGLLLSKSRTLKNNKLPERTAPSASVHSSPT